MELGWYNGWNWIKETIRYSKTGGGFLNGEQKKGFRYGEALISTLVLLGVEVLGEVPLPAGLSGPGIHLSVRYIAASENAAMRQAGRFHRSAGLDGITGGHRRVLALITVVPGYFWTTDWIWSRWVPSRLWRPTALKPSPLPVVCKGIKSDLPAKKASHYAEHRAHWRASSMAEDMPLAGMPRTWKSRSRLCLAGIPLRIWFCRESSVGLINDLRFGER